MSFYERMGITPLINASETYTNLGRVFNGSENISGNAGSREVDL